MSYQQSEFGFRPRFVRKLAGRGLSRGIRMGMGGIRGAKALNTKITSNVKSLPKSLNKQQKKLDDSGISMFIPTKKATTAYEAIKRGPKLARRLFGFGEVEY